MRILELLEQFIVLLLPGRVVIVGNILVFEGPVNLLTFLRSDPKV
jgi:hypothetical protein